MTNPKEQVLAWVRERNPQTMELKFGCKVRWWNESEHGEDGGIESIALVSGGKYWTSPSTVGSAVRTGWSEEEFRDNWTILGSDMGLQELLIALQDDLFEHSVKVIRDMSPVNYNDDYTDVIAFILETFDLTKNLHEQSEEFYKAILPLIT